VCRSVDGAFLDASASVVSGISDPASPEALACQEALALGEDLNIEKLIVASDCLQVINNLHGDSEGGYGMITREIKEKLLEVSPMFVLNMRTGLQIQNLIESSVVLFLSIMVERFGYFSHLKDFVFRC
jgi:hypothetical protein